VYSKTRQRVALALVATFAFAAVGTAHRDDASDLKAKFEALQKQWTRSKPSWSRCKSKGKKRLQPQPRLLQALRPAAKEGAESKQAAIEKLFDKITKGFYGSMDVSGDFTTKGMGDFIAYHIPAWGGPRHPDPRSGSDEPKACELS